MAAATTVWLAFDDLPPPEEVVEVLRANRGVWLPTGNLEEASLEAAKARLELDGDPLRWQRGPPLELPVLPALKDLGVAQGEGKPAKDLQAARAKIAFERLGWIGKLGLSRAQLARLAAASALTAGLYGAAAHVYDKDFLPAMRRWVMHAVYRGSTSHRCGSSCTWSCLARVRTHAGLL